MSQAASGVAKRAEHKAKIAAAQRRRHAAARALTAVEAFHRGLDSASLAGGPYYISARGQQAAGHWHHHYAHLPSVAPGCCLLLCMLARPALAVWPVCQVRPWLWLQW